MAVIVTDVVGFTTHIQSLGDERALHLFHQHDFVVRRSLENYAGLCINHTGDGFFAGFNSVRSAAECALAIRRSAAEHELLSRMGVRLRIALHYGNVLIAPGRLFGLNVVMAFRLCARTRSGDIYATEPFCGRAVAIGYHFGQPKRMRLKGIAEPKAVYPLHGSEVTTMRPNTNI